MELKDIHQKLKTAKCPEDIFGGPVDGSTITPVYRQLVVIVHPDHFQSNADMLALANEAFTQLSDLRAAAERKVKAGTYGKKKVEAPPVKKPFIPMAIEAKGKHFILTDQITSGDVCDLFTCTITNGHAEYPAVFKIVQQGSDNDLLENEAKTLGKLYPPTAKDEKFYRFLPKLMDSFLIRGPGYQRRVNIFPWFDEHRSLEEVVRVFPDGIDYRDMVWMFKRVLHAIGFAHLNHIVHGALIPPHVMIHPINHGAKIIDWSYAVCIEPAPKAALDKRRRYTIYDHLADDDFLTLPHVKAISATYKDYYPPEVLKKETPTSATDIYIAAKCAVALVGGDVATNKWPDAVPGAIQTFFNTCLNKDPSKRPQDAWNLHEELDTLLKRVIGKPKYRPFPMPARS